LCFELYTLLSVICTLMYVLCTMPFCTVRMRDSFYLSLCIHSLLLGPPLLDVSFVIPPLPPFLSSPRRLCDSGIWG
jgi:hypothetical protein